MNDIAPPAFGPRSPRPRGPDLPTVYACSGSSAPAQMMAHAAAKLAERGLARMGCVAALGADVVEAIENAREASHVIALDGCPRACAAKCLRRHRIVPDQHYVAGACAIPDRAFKADAAEKFIERVLADLLSQAPAGS